MQDKNILLSNLDKIHTTKMGVERIKRNLSLETEDIVLWCQSLIKNQESEIKKKRKNWYIRNKDIVLTVNASSYTIITVHKIKSELFY